MFAQPPPLRPAFIVAKWSREDADFYQVHKAFSRDAVTHIMHTLEKTAPTATITVAASIPDALQQMKVCQCNEGVPPFGFMGQQEFESTWKK